MLIPVLFLARSTCRSVLLYATLATCLVAHAQSPIAKLPSLPAQSTLPDMADRALACTGCHGKQGVATAQGYFPRIAGKPVDYLFNQLRHFKTGKRRFKGMNRLIESLPDDYLMAFARHFSALDLPYPAPLKHSLRPTDTERAKLLIKHGDPGKQIPACRSCHGEKLTGVNPVVPGLIGLPRDYITAQFGAWRNQLRVADAPDCMATIAARLETTDITALAGWLASQPVPTNSKPQAKMFTQPVMDCGSFNRNSTAGNSAELAASQPTKARAHPEGRYLAKLGNCAACHTQDPAAPMAGGVAIATPFGRVVGSNITPDVDHGLGDWSADSFFRAMTTGISRDHTPLNPVFPYQFFSGLTRVDSDAIFQWLGTLPSAALPDQTHDLRFPYDSRAALSAWRWLFVGSPAAKPIEPTGSSNKMLAMPQAPTLDRGQYLVQTLMHCNACHGKRNFLGGFSQEGRMGGQLLPGVAGYAPSLVSAREIGLSEWSTEQIEQFLLTGTNRHADANGLMARVVQQSTQHLNSSDATSIALYLKSIAHSKSATATATTAEPAGLTSTPQSWRTYCADCHGDNGEGSDDLAPSLAGRRSVMLKEPANLIQTILYGGFGAATKKRPFPPGMPGFGHRLNDQEVATLATFIRNAWGNSAPAVSSSQVQKRR